MQKSTAARADQAQAIVVLEIEVRERMKAHDKTLLQDLQSYRRKDASNHAGMDDVLEHLTGSNLQFV